MASRALSWKRAAAIGWRDLKSAPGKFAFVVLSVAVGVAALVGVRGLSNSFRVTLSGQARSLIAGDLSARLGHPPTAKDLAGVAAIAQQDPGMQTTWVTETLSMASAPPDPVPLLVSLKAVDPTQYPYYGSVVLDPDIGLQQALAGDSAVVAQEFLIRMNAKVGGTLRLGGRSFRISAVIRQEPDLMTARAGIGPRVMIAQDALARTGLVREGSRATVRLLVKAPAVPRSGISPDAETAALRNQLEAALPDAQVIDYREGNPALTRGLENATSILSLICLVAMVLGAIGVAMAMHAHLEQRMDMLAILKAMGAGSGDLLRIFLLQTLGLGLAGGLVGVAAGIGVMMGLPAAFDKLITIRPVQVFPWRESLAGLGTGLLTTLLFCLPPLLDVRAIRPVLVLRRLVEQREEGLRAWAGRWWARRLQLGIAAAVVAGLGGIAWALADSPKVGGWFALLFTCALAVLLTLAWAALRFIHWLLSRVRLRLPSSLRQGLANLYRPGNQSAPVLAALGSGVMLILAVYLLQAALLSDLHATASPKLPNLFLVDIGQDELAGVKAFFAREPGVTRPLQLVPVIGGRFTSVNGAPVARLRGNHFPLRTLESAELTWAGAPPIGDKVVAGAWWKPGDTNEIAVDEWLAKRIRVGVGSMMELEMSGTAHTLRVAAIYRDDGQHLSARIAFVVPPELAASQVSTWYGEAHLQPQRVAEMERALFAAYPTITVINIADVLGRIESVVDQITFVIRLLAGFSILAGLMILASSIAGTRFRRMQEAVVLKTLGATRMRIVRTFSVEFSVLGLLAGAVGVVFANVLTRVLLHRMDVKFHIEWAAALIALAGTAALATLTGWIASHRILGLRPLEVLRDE
ncbi:MAG: ABC transporter permease [Acidobacteriota bacterium]